MENTELIRSLNKEMAVTLPEQVSADELQALLARHINDLIKNDFERLIAYLYRIDVNEDKLKQLLKQHADEDAGNIIAALIIERQQQKIRSREHSDKYRNSARENNIDEEEKW